MFTTWKNQAVRDLAWVIESPELIDWSLLAPQHLAPASWGARQAAMNASLRDLDKDPTPLLEFLATRPSYRLGIYFEKLLRFWFSYDAAPTLLLQNLPIRDDERTLGELDFVVHNESLIEHWEVGVKYYLGYRGTGSADAWIGPGCKDSLGRKLRRMMNHQLPMVRTEEAVQALLEKGLRVDRSRPLLKGYLFYPVDQQDRCEPPKSVSEDHQRGVWVRVGSIQALEDLGPTQWLPIEKIRWMGGPGEDLEERAYSVAELTPYSNERLAQDDQRPFMLVGRATENAPVSLRCFVVPDDWPQRLPESKTASP